MKLENIDAHLDEWRSKSTDGTVYCPDVERAQELHARSIVIDGSMVVLSDAEHPDRAREGGVTAVNHTVFDPSEGPDRAVRTLSEILRWIDTNSDRVLLVRTADDIVQAKRDGREGIILGPQNSDFLGGDLGLLDLFATGGIRIIQLTYQKQNFAGSGCGEPNDSGLSEFGGRLITEMQRLGLVVDLSHCGLRTSREAAEAAAGPVIFSHAHPLALSPHPRAKDDDLIRLVASKGGVMGTTSFTPFAIPTTAPGGTPDIWDFVRHVAYVVDLVGASHAGIGLDIDETNTAQGWAAAQREFPELYGRWTFDDRHLKALITTELTGNVTRALVTAGFSDDEIEAILGKNFLRVFEEIWR